MQSTPNVKVKGGVIQSRLAFVRDNGGEEAFGRVLARLSDDDRKSCAHVMPAAWYSFELNKRLDEAIAAEMGMGDNAFILMGEKSATHNLGTTHRAFIVESDPHGLLRRTAQIYQAYYDTGRRTYDRLDEKKAVLRTYDSETFSKHDCLTVVGWHKRAIEMCGGTNVRVTETKCRAKGAEICEYVCEWN